MSVPVDTERRLPGLRCAVAMLELGMSERLAALTLMADLHLTPERADEAVQAAAAIAQNPGSVKSAF